MATRTGRSSGILSADDLLTGSGIVHEVHVPLAVLRPAADAPAAPDSTGVVTSDLVTSDGVTSDGVTADPATSDRVTSDVAGSAAEAAGRAGAGRVRLRPLSVGTLALISRAARDDAGLVPLLMIKESLVEPAVPLDAIRRMHVGLVHYLVGQINRISGLTWEGEVLDDVLDAPGARMHLLLARHFGWTPEQVSQLTPGQVAVYLAGVEKLLELERERR